MKMRISNKWLCLVERVRLALQSEAFGGWRCAVRGTRFQFRFASLVLLACAFLVGSRANAAPITLDFSNLDDTAVTFANGTFSFSSNIDGDQFHITESYGGDQDSIGFLGYVAPGGPFSIGSITINGSIQSAPVTGTGMLHITDASSIDLTGSIQWDNITTLGVGGILDLTGTINLTNIIYLGSSVDLGLLAANGAASDVVTFQFVPAQTLTQLAASSGESTSYSGTIYAAPEPASLGLMVLGGITALRRRRR
jgi:hypothetical protein